MTRCPLCQKGTRKKSSKVPYTQKVCGHTFTVNVTATVCSHCGDIEYPAKELYRADLQVAGALARAGVVSAEAFRFMRAALGFTSSGLAELLGVAPNSLSRWETETRRLDPSAAAILSRMVLDALEGREAMQETLRSQRAPKKLPKALTLEAGAR